MTNQIFLAIALATYGSALAATKPFERVETFPTGEQASGMKALINPKAINTESVLVNKPYAAVWSAVKVVARTFDKVGKRSLVAIDEQSGRVQNGKISSDALIAGNTFDWKDEFVIEVTKVTAQSTNLSVSRRLVKKGTGWGDTNTNWQSRNSNGLIERWLITQVIEQLKSPAVEKPVDETGSTTYVYKEDATNFIVLNTDGTFRTVQHGKQFRGQYSIAGEELSLTVGAQVIKSRITGDSVWDTSGKEWVKKSDEARGPAKAPAAGNSRDTNFTNADVMKLAEAKLPDSVIISKIKSSSCNFDVSTDALIKLKSASVSDSVVQAIVECKAQ